MEEHKYGVFIIESMDLNNELNKKMDGLALKSILDLCDIPCIYYYIRTKLELKEIILKFDESKFRYLHLSCHGNEERIKLTFEAIYFEELESIIGKHLKYKRLFLSACKVARFELAEYFIPKYHCYSVIGSPDNISYKKAAVFWSSFYYLMHVKDSKEMFQVNILPILLKITGTFQLKLNYFSIINQKNFRSIDHLREINIENGNKIDDNYRKTRFINQYR
jgi:hypothetical protein